jgi:RNA polymerase sigma-70 factor, ECF subfamily
VKSDTNSSEQALIARARCSNSDAFTELVNLHYRRIYRVSLDILRNHADAEDNSQDVLCKLYKNIHRFEGRSRLSTWLVRIAINEAYMKVRSRASKGFMTHIDISNANAVPDGHPDPERQCVSAELILKALHGLHPLVKRMFTLHIASGWTHRELAGAIGITTETAKSRIFRARVRMQRQLGGHCRELI